MIFKYSTWKEIRFNHLIIIGLISFLVFYILAAAHYPGGSDFNKKQTGFSWYNNYWCELLGEFSKNGHHNKARPFGIIGMIILSISLCLFWMIIPNKLKMNTYSSWLVRSLGITSMIFSNFILTRSHDLIIAISIFTGVIALFITIRQLKEYNVYYYWSGLIIIFFIISDCIIYTSKFLIFLLPVLQKITFAEVLIWFFAVTLAVKK